MGWPLSREEFGGGFIYNMSDGRVSIGLVVGLDYLDPRLDPHRRFQEFKTHPFIRGILEGGTLYSYGAKTIPEGGYWAQPQYYFNGGMIVGDSGGFLNAMRLKGIHLSFKTGMLAAQAASEALAASDFSEGKLKRFHDLVESLGERGTLEGSKLPPGFRAWLFLGNVPHESADGYRRPRFA
jgi:electron-transferring-flavoprotein dehydrogenase